MTVHAVQREVLVEVFEPEKALQRRSLHARRIGKAHVVLDERENLPRLVV